MEKPTCEAFDTKFHIHILFELPNFTFISTYVQPHLKDKLLPPLTNKRSYMIVVLSETLQGGVGFAPGPGGRRPYCHVHGLG